MCLRVCRVCPLASVNACVLFSAWLPSALAISLSLPWEKCFWLCVRSQIAANAAVESLGFEAMKMTSGCDSPWTQQGRIFPFRGVGNAVIVIAIFWERLVLNVTVMIQSLGWKTEERAKREDVRDCDTTMRLQHRLSKGKLRQASH